MLPYTRISIWTERPKWRRSLWATALGLTVTWCAMPARCDVTVTAGADPSHTEVGRKIAYEIVATYPAGTQVEWPATGSGLEEFQIQDFERLEETKAPGGNAAPASDTPLTPSSPVITSSLLPS